MRILCIAVYQSNHCDRHINLLARAGFEVHLAIVDSCSRPCLVLHPSITVHSRHQDGIAEQLPMPSLEAPCEALMTDADLLTMADIALPSHGAVLASEWLASLIDRIQPAVCHSFSLHQTGFITAVARKLCSKDYSKWIVSNWGCDIHFFSRQIQYRRALAATLDRIDGYFAECARDARLARELGMTAPVIGVQPIGGGFDLDWFFSLRTSGLSSRRKVIMLKGYSGLLGRSHVALESIGRMADRLRHCTIVVYAADDLRPDAIRVIRDLGLSVRILPHLPYEDLMRWHGRARCSIALSASDGICTSAIEAMLMGSLPLQSDSSCIGEWTHPDATLLVPCDDPTAVEAALHRALNDDFVDRAVMHNDRSLRERFAPAVVNAAIVGMYKQIAN